MKQKPTTCRPSWSEVLSTSILRNCESSFT